MVWRMRSLTCSTNPRPAGDVPPAATAPNLGRMRATALLSAGLAVTLVLAGCGDDDEPAVGAGATTTTTTTSQPARTDTSSTGADPTTSTTTTTAAPEGREVELTFSGGEVTGGPQRVAVAAGERVRLLVTSDVAEEVHVHGYDLEVALAPGTPTPIDLVGDLPGVWEVELHGSGDVLCELEVQA